VDGNWHSTVIPPHSGTASGRRFRGRPEQWPHFDIGGTCAYTHLPQAPATCCSASRRWPAAPETGAALVPIMSAAFRGLEPPPCGGRAPASALCSSRAARLAAPRYSSSSSTASWREQIETVRRQQATRLLGEGKTRLSVAVRLGYCDDRTLRRAMHRWQNPRQPPRQPPGPTGMAAHDARTEHRGASATHSVVFCPPPPGRA